MSLIFNDDVDNEVGAVQEINDICKSDDNSFPLASKARRVNFALNRFLTLAFQADGKWAFDDISHGNVPVDTINLVANQKRYQLDFTSNIEMINLLRVERLNNSGIAEKMTRIDRSMIDIALSEVDKVPSVPYKYDLLGEYIDLYPAPSYNKVAGLIFYFNRGAVKFTKDDTTKIIPVPSLFEEYICNLASIKFLAEEGKDNYAKTLALIIRDEKEIATHYANREKGDESDGMIETARINSR